VVCHPGEGYYIGGKVSAETSVRVRGPVLEQGREGRAKAACSQVDRGCHAD